MKTGASAKTLGLILASAILATVSQIGCGKPADPIVPPAIIPPVGQSDQISMPIRGFAGYGSQCPSGYNSAPKPVKLELWSCPINLKQMELTEPLQPLIMQADCARKVLTIRTANRSIDTNWEVMPDGTFYITLDGLSAKLKDDGSGNADCTTTLSTDIWGKIECNNPQHRDQAKITFETVMWLNKKSEAPTTTPSGGPVNPNLPVNNGPSPSATPSAAPSTTPSPTPSPRPIPTPSHLLSMDQVSVGQCKLPPAKCYFHTLATVSQCE